MQHHDLESHKKYVNEKIQILLSVLSGAAIGDFSQNIPPPKEHDEFTPLYVRVAKILDTVRDQLDDLRRINQDLENKVRERTTSLDETQHIAHIGSWHWDIKKNTVTWSDELYAIYGLRPHEFNGTFEGFLARVHPDDVVRVRDIIDRAYNGEEDFKFDHRIVRMDGKIRTLHVEGRVIRNATDHAVLMFGIGQDISEQIESRNRLLKRDKVLQVLGIFSKNALRESSWQKNIESVYKFLGEALSVDRISIYQNTTDENKVIYTERITQWSAPGMPPRSSAQPTFTHFSFPQYDLHRWASELSKGQAIVGNVKGLPRPEEDFLAAQNVVSIIITPIFSGGDWWGFITFEECRHVREWDVVDIEAAGTITEILGAAIEREQVHLRLTMRTLELEKLNKLMIGRELKMAQLKEEIRKLSGVPPSSG